MMEGKMVDVDPSKIVHIVITVAFTLWVILVIAYCYVIEVFRKRHPRCPRCKSDRTSRIKYMEYYHCEDCNLNFERDEKR